MVVGKMAAPGACVSVSGSEDAFNTYYNEVKQIERRDSVLTPKQQIERLLRPGSTYFNLNPYEVLQLDPEATDEEIKKRFRQGYSKELPGAGLPFHRSQDFHHVFEGGRIGSIYITCGKKGQLPEGWDTKLNWALLLLRFILLGELGTVLSILVHPDKNQDDPERAQKAFEAVDKAYKGLLEPEHKKRALDVIQAGQEYIDHIVKEKRKVLKKEGKPTVVPEDDPEVFKQAVYKQTMKLFAELEIKRKEREAKDMHERKRQREEEIETAEKAKRDREWQKNFEESRDGRVDSWRTFQAHTKGGKKEKKNRTFLKPPKVKMEQRE